MLMANEDALLREVDRLCTDEAMRALIARAAFGGTAPPAFDLRIHPADQMLLHSLRHHNDANAAFSQYYNVALQQYRAAYSVIRAIFGERAQALHILDFACGFGRLLRFLRHAIPQRLHAAEIQEEALAFVGERFGVETIPSAFDPEAFQPGERFDVIWVASLFSHLPPRLFHAWLARLLRLSGEEEGIVCFTVHDICLLPDPAHMPENGILFFPSSENPDLDASLYGTTYVTEAFVREAVARAGGGKFDYYRIPRALAHEQDLYVASRRGAHDLSRLGGFRYGPWGWVDEKRLSAAKGLYLRGWAASLDDGQVDFVDIRVGKQEFRCPTGLPRDDVAKVFADPRLATCGWEFRCPALRDGDGPVRVEVTASSARGEIALLYAGDLP
jgi:SAM-dependent methyltransferase